MSSLDSNNISIRQRYRLPVAPDTVFVKVHFAGDGMTLVDATGNVNQKISSAKERLTEAFPQITKIEAFDVYTGQKDDGIRSESQAFPRPLVVRGLLICTEPKAASDLCEVVDNLVKHGAQPSSPQRRSYISDALDSALLYGVVDHRDYESQAITACLAEARQRAEICASAAGLRIGELSSISDVEVLPTCDDPFKRDFAHIQNLFPTSFLSASSTTVIFYAKLIATYTLVKL